MAIVYILAHFDDEYFAFPLLTAAVRAGADQRFFYVADYASPEMARRRHAESRALLARLGVDPAHAVHVGRGTGAIDGRVHLALGPAHAALAGALAEVGSVERIVVTAWEGGHMDHDMCALLAAELAPQVGNPPIETISLYNGVDLPRPLFHCGRPLAENGAIRTARLAPAEWLRWMAAVRFFPSQMRSWCGLWPMMFAAYARRGYATQRLDPTRTRQRPHAGPLLYERMFKVPYEEVAAARDAYLRRATGPAGSPGSPSASARSRRRIASPSAP